MTFISLADTAATDRHLVGGKAIGLGRLLANGFRVPDGFVIPAEVEQSKLADLLHQELDGDHRPYAYRSSAVAEDLGSASFAGQYETVLGVVGAAAGAEAVHRVRASADADAPSAYRRHATGGEAGMAVIVQRQIEAQASGVAFSHNPITGVEEVLIEAVVGVGEALMDGTVNPEKWTVATQPELVELNDEPVLSSSQATEIAELCRRAESALGRPQDVEWAIDGDGIWLLQARPITALPVEPTARPNPKTAWVRSDAFFPEPVTPLTYTTWLPTHTRATGRAFELLGIPAGGMEHGYFWGRVYDRIIPLVGGEDDTKGLPPGPMLKLVMRIHPGFRARLKSAAESARSDLPVRLIDDWEDGGRCRIRTRARELRSVDLGALSDLELADHLTEIRAHAFDCGVEHFKMSFVGWVLVGQLGILAEELAGWEPERVIDLVQGHGDGSRFEADALALVCEAVASDPEAKAIIHGAGDLRTYSGAAGEAMRLFLDEYGHRAHDSLVRPTWAEDPGPVQALIASRLNTGETVTADLKDMSSGAEEYLLASAKSDEARKRLSVAIERARRGRPYGDETERDPSEAMGLIHYAAMEAADRLVHAGRLRERGDVEFLEIDELDAALRGGAVDSDAIERRKAEHRWALANPAPRTLGPRAAPAPNPGLFPAATRPTAGAFLWAAANLFFVEPLEPDTDGSLRGFGASAGVHEGTARVIRSHAEFDRVQPGDVVVCPSTMASWSPIFPIIGGLVTEVGGPLSHPGTLAREFGLPAVLAVADATLLIEEGSRVRIDGAHGTVTVLD